MAHGRNAVQRSREYWSRRPYSGIGWGKDLKILTHRKERRDGERLLRHEDDGT